MDRYEKLWLPLITELRSDAPLNDVDLASDELGDPVPDLLESTLLNLPWKLPVPVLALLGAS